MTLDKDLITQPQLWQLVMELTPSALCVMAFSPVEHDAMISTEIALDPASTPLKAFQDAVYANPLLLSDFKVVTMLLPETRFMPVPHILSDTDSDRIIFRRAFPEDQAEGATEILREELPGMDADILMEVNTQLLGFIRRTFNNPRITHALAPQALYFNGINRLRSRGKMFVNLRGSRCDVVVLGDGAPLLLNSYPVNHPLDAVYFVMAIRSTLDIHPEEEIILAGDTASRAAVTSLLKRYVRYVIPAIFPSVMFRAGNASLRTPFEMIVAPLV